MEVVYQGGTRTMVVSKVRSNLASIFQRPILKVLVTLKVKVLKDNFLTL